MLNQAMYDKQSKTKMLVGLSNRDGLQQDPFSGWFNKEYGAYAVNKEAVQGIDSENLSIKLFMGTWCRDSRREVPRIYRILDAAGFDESRLTLINVDRGKNSPGGEEVGLNIHHVPTVILYKNGSEIGRIIETPVQLLEEDMTAILNGTGYTPNYSDFGVN
jgi:thiol-disulfide isomerase/thioredoxin